MIIQCQYCPHQTSSLTRAVRHFEIAHRGREEYATLELPVWMGKLNRSSKVYKNKSRIVKKAKTKASPENLKADKDYDDFLIDFCNPHGCPIWTCQGTDVGNCKYWEEYKYKKRANA